MSDDWNQPGQSDPISGPGTVNMTPGKLSMKAEVKFHSRLAINLFRGRKADPAKGIRPIIGLARFAQQSAQVWSSASRDDPMADMILIRIEEAHDAAELLLKNCLAVAEGMLESLNGFSIDVEESIRPVSLELKFYSPWAWKGALLLKKYDELVRASLTARHMGLLTSEDWTKTINSTGTAIRHMFVQADAFVMTPLKRSNFTRTKKAVEKKYAERKRAFLYVPREVLIGELRAKLSPPIKKYEQIEREERALERQEDDRRRAIARAESGVVVARPSWISARDTITTDARVTEVTGSTADNVAGSIVSDNIENMINATSNTGAP